MRPRRRGIILVILAILCVGPQLSASEVDLRALLDGVERVKVGGVPGPVAPIAPEAFAVLTGEAEGTPWPVVAASRYGEGRVVATGHFSFLDANSLQLADTARLILNAIRWASASDNPRVGVFRRDGFAEALAERGLDARQIDLSDLSDLDCIVVAPERAPAERMDALDRFVREGGGMVTAFLGWGWLQLNPDRTLARDSLSNRLLAPMGIVWLDGYLPQPDEGYGVGEGPPAPINANAALDAAIAHETGERELSERELSLAGALLSRTAGALPAEDRTLRPRINEMVRERGDVIPTAEQPVTADRVLDRLALTVRVQEMMAAPPGQIRAHPAARVWPGAVADDAPRTDRPLQVDCSTWGWKSTGLYAPPGEVIEVELADGAAAAGLGLRIGSCTDRLWHKAEWQRVPEISRHFALNAPVTRAANAFGGLIYLTVPRDCDLAVAEVVLRGAVEAPLFVLGETDVDDWRARIRNFPAPRAELAAHKVTLTVPSGVIRDLDNPRPLLRLWDRVMDLNADLAAHPGRERDRPLRYCADVQISAGWMHAGYPIMVPAVTAERLVDYDHLLNEGDWGFFHEMGHMHQSGDWTFGGAGEVTVNLFTLYVFDMLCGKDKCTSHRGLTGEKAVQKFQQYFADGAPFDRWKRDPFLALRMYVQLQQAFGWDAFKAVFAEYRDLPEEQRPETDDDKRDQWMVRFSQQVGRNLGPFFEVWGVPTSEDARKSIANLPEWMPEDFPPTP
ncbi:MAG: M60 family metallopeptidase [Armatimonadota bacterium]